MNADCNTLCWISTWYNTIRWMSNDNDVDDLAPTASSSARIAIITTNTATQFPASFQRTCETFKAKECGWVFIYSTDSHKTSRFMHYFFPRKIHHNSRIIAIYGYLLGIHGGKNGRKTAHKKAACEASITPPYFPPRPLIEGGGKGGGGEEETQIPIVHRHHIVYYSGLGNRSNWMHLLTSFHRPSAIPLFEP